MPQFQGGAELALLGAKLMNLQVLALALLSLSLGSCIRSARGETHSEPFSFGFWWWRSYDSPAVSSRPADLIYAQAGSINLHRSGWPSERRPLVWGDLPPNLPPASEYWMVYRQENQGAPEDAAANELIANIWAVWGEARSHHIKMAGVQLDIDSATGYLPDYAAFLAKVRKGLPAGCQLSITALLDWFRSGTAVADVIRQTDEFVPQFYDVAPVWNTDVSISARVDGARWGPVFNRFGKRFRIGVSTFGRAQSTHGERRAAFRSYVDLTPLDFGVNPEFRLSVRRNESNELILRYQALGRTNRDPVEFNAGDAIEFIVATPEAVRSAVEGARRMGGHCAGVVFFRWPQRSETLLLQPDEALAAAGTESAAVPQPVDVTQVDANCAAVHCADLYLVNVKPWNPATARYRIQASGELEYFVPDIRSLVQIAGPARLDVGLPPYAGRGRILLGRAVSHKAVQFTVEAMQ
jgi:hypothetical protein